MSGETQTFVAIRVIRVFAAAWLWRDLELREALARVYKEWEGHVSPDPHLSVMPVQAGHGNRAVEHQWQEAVELDSLNDDVVTVVVPAGDVADVRRCVGWVPTKLVSVLTASTVRSCIVAGAIWIQRDPEPDAASARNLCHQLDLVHGPLSVVSRSDSGTGDQQGASECRDESESGPQNGPPN